MTNKGHWDTHIHAFDSDAYPYSVPRYYTPKPALLTEYRFDSTNCQNIVTVQATVYGHSPDSLLTALKAGMFRPNGCFLVRDLCTVDLTEATDAELNALHGASVRGMRFHEFSCGLGIQNGVNMIAKKIKAASRRIARLGWIIDVFFDLHSWVTLDDVIRTELDPRVKLVADHLGGAFPGDEDPKSFEFFTSLVRDGFLYVKLSGFERLYHGQESGMKSLSKIGKAIVAAGPETILYGSDWPHTQLGIARKGKTDQQRLEEVGGFRDVIDVGHLQTSREWIVDDKV